MNKKVVESTMFQSLKTSLGVVSQGRPKHVVGQRISVTGFRNGISRQEFLFQPADKLNYLALGLEMLTEMRPVGVRETQLAQRIIDANWRLNRLASVTNNLEIVLILEASQQAHSSDDHSQAALSQSYAWKQDCQAGHSAFESIARMDARLSRQLSQWYTELAHVQQARVAEVQGVDVFAIETCKAYNWYAVSLEFERSAPKQGEPAPLTAAAVNSSLAAPVQADEPAPERKRVRRAQKTMRTTHS